ncbi:acetyl-CoA C-acetyltransferase [Deferribacter desulfuricans SSM1]|uniref:Acetyl-CoA C-acetyltransferase n=1 Tax=Deferribacter desulfuricans (strain DSM 14783 / JCM 11476 / NBRC 101012 / SSM1) TaxID=639282 RepID=D3P9A2_DEFDS|nr:thiolase family protein [Deferribacter desulfuricans]BAI81292.1 acetyl-CoA C-acetyltransferase [Deferribacter desulfuricans SSM1]
MRDVFVVEGLRTPFGSFGGSLSDVHPAVLAADVIKKLLEKTEVKPDDIDEVILGQVLTGGFGQAPARQAMRYAGLLDKVHAMTINKVCGSGLKALMLGAQSIMLGDSDLAIVGGMENMSMAPYALLQARYGYRMGNNEVVDLMIYDALLDPYTKRHMGELTEETIKKVGVTREEQDDYAERSYKLSQKAVESGIFDEEVVPVVKKTKKGDIVVDKDEEPFRVNFEKLRQLRPVFVKDGTITAGNASTINDGAACLLLASEDAVKKYNLKPIGRLVAYATNSIHPDEFSLAPVGAIEKVCEKAGLKLDDIDLFEINEAFAAVVLFAVKKLNLPLDKVNVNGGAVSIGHPVGASGGRLAVTLLKEMQRRNAKYGLATLCIGGGEAVSAIFERV